MCKREPYPTLCKGEGLITHLNFMGKHYFSSAFVFGLIVSCCLFQSCKKYGSAKTAFYYWKSSLNLDSGQYQLLQQTGNNPLYTRFFDVSWDVRKHRAFPNAIVNFKQRAYKVKIVPVIFITNKTFENIKDDAIDSLAVNSNALINRLASKEHISYQTIQVDCDWTITSREKYFHYLAALKNISRHRLECTIRLHQVKYKDRTGIPPVDKGILMFYNMGKLNAGLNQPNSIYNEADAQKYVAYIPQYPLSLDVALPLFSWAVLVRNGRVVQLYGNIGKKELSNVLNFDQNGRAYRSKKSFFLNGIYIKENDIFKLEQTDASTLKKAAGQLAQNLPQQQNRTIIYYELGNIDQSEFTVQTLNEVSADL